MSRREYAELTLADEAVGRGKPPVKPKIKIKFTDFWDVFDEQDNFITKALCNNFDYEISDEPDFVFCSLFGRRHLKYRCAKIFFTGENILPDFNLVDYGMGFQEISFYDRYLRLPLYVLYPEVCEMALHKHMNSDEYYLKNRKFCNFVISNAISDPARDKMIDVLSTYKQVDSGGRYRNNVGGPVPDKVEFQKGYKFTMAFENTSSRGYTTEKVMEAFASGTVPIYWGNPDIAKEFNPKAFINCHDFASFEDVLEEIKRIDADDELYLSMVKAPIVIDDSAARTCLSGHYLEDYLKMICSQSPREAIRRNTIYQGEYYENEARFHEKFDRVMYTPKRFVHAMNNKIKIKSKS